MKKKREKKNAHAFQFNVAQLLKQPSGTRRVYDIDASALPPVDDDLEVVAPFRGRIRFMRVGNGILVTGALETTLKVACTRCLNPVPVSVQFEIEEEFKPTIDILSGGLLPQEPDQDAATLIDERHILDLAEVVRQNLLLNLPSSAVCRPDCRGLCPQCGQDLNQASCDCQAEAADPRWAALKESFEK